jgi:hypothetical protein
MSAQTRITKSSEQSCLGRYIFKEYKFGYNHSYPDLHVSLFLIRTSDNQPASRSAGSGGGIEKAAFQCLSGPLLAIGGARLWGKFGTVLEPMDAYHSSFTSCILHVIHPAAALLGFPTHQPVAWLLHGGFFLNYPPDGQPYGHGLGVVCAMWAAVILLLYWPCACLLESKKKHPDSLLRFL